jgi:hypothetical protein
MSPAVSFITYDYLSRRRALLLSGKALRHGNWREPSGNHDGDTYVVLKARPAVLSCVDNAYAWSTITFMSLLSYAVWFDRTRLLVAQQVLLLRRNVTSAKQLVGPSLGTTPSDRDDRCLEVESRHF